MLLTQTLKRFLLLLTETSQGFLLLLAQRTRFRRIFGLKSFELLGECRLRAFCCTELGFQSLDPLEKPVFTKLRRFTFCV